MTPEQRLVHFGQSDHVRVYGSDFRERVREAGFSLDEFTVSEPHIRLHGLIPGDKIFVARPVLSSGCSLR